MSYLEMLKQAEARLWAARQRRAGDERDEITKEVFPSLPEPRHLDAYRAALREFWHLMARSSGIDATTAARIRDEVVRFEDEVGEPRAMELRHQWEADWHRETGRCPRCGEPGKYHDDGATP
jgi:hypothetical protein